MAHPIGLTQNATLFGGTSAACRVRAGGYGALALNYLLHIQPLPGDEVAEANGDLRRGTMASLARNPQSPRLY
jgi:hypothetical protein